MTIDQILKLKWFRNAGWADPDSLWSLREEIMRYLWQTKPEYPIGVLTTIMATAGFHSKRVGTTHTQYFKHEHTGEVISFNNKDLT